MSDIEVAGSSVYIGGVFTSAHGVPRNHFAAIDVATGLATPWDPNPNTPATSLSFPFLEVDGGLVYVAGLFSTIGGQDRLNLASVDPVTGLASPWNPGGGSAPLSIMDGIVYLGGSGAIDATTGALASWNPSFYSGQCCLDFSPPGPQGGTLEAGDGVVYVGADFYWYGVYGGQLRSGIAAVAGVSTSAPAPDAIAIEAESTSATPDRSAMKPASPPGSGGR